MQTGPLPAYHKAWDAAAPRSSEFTMPMDLTGVPAICLPCGVSADGLPYSIQFTAPDTYQVLDAGNNVVASGNYTDGGSISFKGTQVTLSGTPAAGDSFTVSPSTMTAARADLKVLNMAISCWRKHARPRCSAK